MPLMFVAMVIYVFLLLKVSHCFNGIIKGGVSLLLYILFVGIFLSPMYVLLINNQPEIRDSFAEIFMVLISYFIIMSPALYYLLKVKMKELQRAGYYSER